MAGGCPSPAAPHRPAADATLEIGRAGSTLRGIAGDGERLYAALADTAGHTAIEARRGDSVVWTATEVGSGGPLARSGSLVVAALAQTGGDMRGQPGARLVALDAATGAARWQLAIDSTQWSVVSALAAFPDGGAIVGGSFAGTLRAGSRVVSSAGLSDGFVARVTPAGQIAWLVRVGGMFADAVQGVAVGAGQRIAIAGEVTSGAELAGVPLPPFDERLATADAFVAELDGNGARLWATTFGGPDDDAVAGVAIDERGRVAVAATVRDTVRVGTVEIPAQGPADGVVAWLSPSGVPAAAVRLGGADFDGLRAITAVGDRAVVGGFFSGAIKLGDHALTAGGGDDAFLAAVDGDGKVIASWQVGGPGREEIAALAAFPGGFVAGVTHTAAATVDRTAPPFGGAAGRGQAPTVDLAKLPSPADPMAGAALVVRAVP